jgi:hypothetical protein
LSTILSSTEARVSARESRPAMSACRSAASGAMFRFWKSASTNCAFVIGS